MPELPNKSKDMLEKLEGIPSPFIKEFHKIKQINLPSLMFAAIDNDLLAKVDLIKNWILKNRFLLFPSPW